MSRQHLRYIARCIGILGGACPALGQTCDWTLRTNKGPERRSSGFSHDSARGVTVLFGGRAPTGSTGETWEWDGSSWSRVATTGPIPQSDPAMAFDSARGVTVLFGVDGQTWEWDGNNWVLRDTTGPPARYGAAMAYDSNRRVCVLHGGIRRRSVLGDTWEWDGTVWSFRGDLSGPWPRAHHSLVYDSVRDVCVLFGGDTVTVGRTSDTWEWDGAAWTLRALTGPSPRWEHAMAYDSARAVTVLFGGDDGGESSETWEWDGELWRLQTFIGPGGRRQHAMAYDSARGVTIVHGGFGTFTDTWEMTRCAFLGDMNCDGSINGADIDPFFLALGDPPAYSAAFPECNINNGDMNCDQAVNGADIDIFFAWMAGNSGPDCNANGIPDDCEGIGPLAIVTPPQSTLACVGDTVTLSVESSSPPLTFQWRKNGNPIAGATSTRLRFSPVQLSDAGDYDVIVGDACVSLTSDSATLTVHTAPAITTHPRSQNICLGAPLFLSVGAAGPALTYQWRKDGTDIPGATGPNFIINAVSVTDAGLYDVLVANTCGSVRSDAATVTIQTTILTHPASQTVCVNDPVFFTVGATGAGLTYQWRKDGVNISGATLNFFVISAAVLSDSGIYDVVVTSTQCTQTSDPATLVVQQCP